MQKLPPENILKAAARVRKARANARKRPGVLASIELQAAKRAHRAAVRKSLTLV